MNPDNHFENNIPTLTDVIAKNQEADLITAPTIHAAHAHLEHDLTQLEKNVLENVLGQLLTRVDFVLEHRIRDSLANVLETAVTGLAKDIRQGLNNSLGDVIQRAINQEISKIRSANTKM